MVDNPSGRPIVVGMHLGAFDWRPRRPNPSGSIGMIEEDSRFWGGPVTNQLRRPHPTQGSIVNYGITIAGDFQRELEDRLRRYHPQGAEFVSPTKLNELNRSNNEISL